MHPAISMRDRWVAEQALGEEGKILGERAADVPWLLASRDYDGLIARVSAAGIAHPATYTATELAAILQLAAERNG